MAREKQNVRHTQVNINGSKPDKRQGQPKLNQKREEKM